MEYLTVIIDRSMSVISVFGDANYDHFNKKPFLPEGLNLLGDDEWELVGPPTVLGDNLMYTLKRQLRGVRIRR